MIGGSPGLTLRKLGGVVISIGSLRAATVSAVCTSSAAPSMLRLRSNWMMIWRRPSAEVEVIEVMPAMVDKLPLDRAGDRRRHGFGAGARQGGGDLDGRKIDRRQRRDRQQPIAEDAEHDEATP